MRFEKDLAYRDYFEKELPQDEILGDIVRDKLLYYPAVTREPFPNQGRLTTLMETGLMQQSLGLPQLDPANDRFMICGSPQMLADLRNVLDARGFQVSSRIGTPGHYVFERAFVEK
ncbi:Ferredoxin--NADP reductase [compost metagenome]